jgi:hypothetical protein
MGHRVTGWNFVSLPYSITPLPIHPSPAPFLNAVRLYTLIHPSPAGRLRQHTHPPSHSTAIANSRYPVTGSGDRANTSPGRVVSTISAVV